jgi:outer membrane protein OmpA-like peptidoglycan-associated protein
MILNAKLTQILIPNNAFAGEWLLVNRNASPTGRQPAFWLSTKFTATFESGEPPILFVKSGANVVFYALFALFFLSALTVNAQKDRQKFKKGGVIQLNDSVATYGQSDIFNFPNLNKVSFYYDADKIHAIQKADNAADDKTVYPLLKTYVQHFGIQNFSKNAPMIWKLAKLSEQFGSKGEALLLYKLVLKHHQQGLNINEVYARHDSIEKDKKKYYVPLDYYYDLVNYRRDIDTLRPPHAVLVNMGDQINSDKEDYGPTIGPADNILLFTSKRHVSNNGMQRVYDEDLFYATRVDSAWSETKDFRKINTSYNEGSACLSKDGKTMIFSRCNAPDSYGNCDLYSAIMQPDSSWTDIKNMGATVNSTGWDSQPSLSHSGDTLFFASDRLGGFGYSDIYFTIKDSKGNWSKAQNAGPIVNTVAAELSPFYHHRFNVLYFSSNGHPLNFGDFDIYKSYWQKSNWGEPQNIGPLVNGEGSEYYFTIDSKSYELYYARSNGDDRKNLDLYSFRVPMEAQPQAIVSVKGTLKDKSGKPLKGIVSVIDLDKGVEVAPKFIREDGSFDFSLINKRNYLLIIQGDEFFRIEEIFFLDGPTEFNEVAEPIESSIAFQSLEFENGKADILEAMHPDLDKLGNFLLDHPDVKLTISGHTDSAGKEEANLRLSQARADAIKYYLTYQFRISADRVAAIGYGSSKPIAQELTDDHKQLNRRVEFSISKD